MARIPVFEAGFSHTFAHIEMRCSESCNLADPDLFLLDMLPKSRLICSGFDDAAVRIVEIALAESSIIVCTVHIYDSKLVDTFTGLLFIVMLLSGRFVIAPHHVTEI